MAEPKTERLLVVDDVRTCFVIMPFRTKTDVARSDEVNFDAVYEDTIATSEFRKATDILTGLWEKLRERPGEYLEARTIEQEGLDAALRDFIAGMTDRFAVRLFEQLFIPKPWTE